MEVFVMSREQKLELYKNRSKRIMEGIREGLKRKKRYQIFFGILFVLWAAAGAQWIAGKFLFSPKEMTEVFAETNSKLSESTLEIIADYGEEFLTIEDQKELIRYLAAGIGLNIEEDISVIEEENRQVIFYEKQANQAQTTLKCVTLGQNDTNKTARTHYLLVRICIYKDTGLYLSSYQQKVRKLLDNLGAKERNCTVQFAGNFAGKLTVSQLNEIADRLLAGLDAKVICENRTEELYTVYGYARGQQQSITVDGKKINIQIAAAYEENEDRTKIYLATPMISGDW